jgi:hypothetical protein
MELISKLQQKADLVCILILCDRISDQTIEGERKLLRSWVEKFFPDQLDLYDMIYESRFDRLISQFRTMN